MTLRRRIALLSATLVVLGAGEGLFAVLAMREMNASSQAISLESLPAIFVLGRVDSLGKDVRGKMRSHCVSTDKKEMAQIQTDAVKLGANFDREMESYAKGRASADESRLREGVLAAKDQFFKKWAEIEPVSSHGDKKQAMKRFLAEGMPAFQQMQTAVAALSTYKKNEADRNIANAAEVAKKGEAWVAGIVLIAIIGGAALSWMLVQWVQRKVGGIATELGRASATVTTAADQVEASSTQVSSATVSQAASLEETSAASHQVSATARSNADACTHLLDCMRRVEQEMGDGGKAMQALKESIAAIVLSSKNISKVLLTIDGIAFQTNILALNAAVEAARAGQAGQGFAVVADEVRNLSLRCAEAAKQTGEFIEESVRNAHEGESRVTEATRLFAAVTDDAMQAGNLSSNVHAGSKEQAVGVEQISLALAELERTNQQNAAASENSSFASRALNEQAKGLQALIAELQAIAG